MAADFISFRCPWISFAFLAAVAGIFLVHNFIDIGRVVLCLIVPFSNNISVQKQPKLMY